MKNILEFNDIVNKAGKYVYVSRKSRINTNYYTADEAHEWLGESSTNRVGWYIGDDYIVLDFDKKKEAKNALLLLKHYNIKTLVCKTGKGIHIYFRYSYTGSQRVNGHLACGLRCDLKVTNKGYVLLPFNITDRRFNRQTDIADMPVFFQPIDVSASAEQYIPAQEGLRNDSFFKQGSRLRAKGYTDDEIKDTLQACNVIQDDPVKDSELDVLIAQVCKFEANDIEKDQFLTRNDDGKVIGLNHDAMATFIANTYHYFIVKDMVYWYDEGAYNSATGDMKLKDIIKKLIPIQSLIKANTILEIYKLCLLDISKHYNMFVHQHPNMIAFTNGTYDFNIGKLVPHSPNHICLVKLDYECGGVNYKDSKLATLIKRFDLAKDDVHMLLDYYASIMCPRNFKSLMFVYGKSNTGKSIIGLYARQLATATNTSAITLDALNGTFNTAQLYGKLLNWYGDSGAHELKSIANLKALTGGDPIPFEKKFKDADNNFINFAKFMYNFNSLPAQREDKSDAFYERLRILEVQKVQNFQDSWVKEVINSAPELSLWLCDRAYKILQRDEQIVRRSANSIKLVGDLRNYSDNVTLWLDERTTKVEATDHKETYQALRLDYQLWCGQHEQTAQSTNKFSQTLAQFGYVNERIADGKGGKVRVVHGIKIRN